MEVTLGFFDEATGELVLDAELPFAQEIAKDIDMQPIGFGCANPDQPQSFPVDPDPTEQTITVRDFWHNSHVEGPGRRSVVRMQGCPIHCKGCWVPETWSFEGNSVGISRVVDTLLDRRYSRDGVTILGGEPFAQPDALRALIEALREDEPDLHITVYSGFTLKTLVSRGFADLLDQIDILIDGPYVEALAHDNCGCDEEVRQFTGSCNQKVRELRNG